LSRYQKVSILNFPKISLEAPPLAPGILAAICKNKSIDYTFVDCNLELHQQLSKDQQNEILGLYAENFITTISEQSRKWLDRYFDELALRCRDSDLIAISVFSVHSVVLTLDFLSRCRSKLDADIVIGGAGIKYSNIKLKEQNLTIPFYSHLYNSKFIDYWILGEGEKGFEELLDKNTSTVSINNHQFNHLENFEIVPIPNFDRFDLDGYRFKGKKIVSVEGSRGCVKKCTFCDIQNTWGKFKYKNGKKLAEELIALQKHYQVDHFWFNDSLINGSLKAFREFTHHLAQIRNKGFTWSSQAIVRPKSPKDREDFELMKRSGCETLAVGIESFSESARFHMGKKFTDDDLDNFLNLAQEYGISLVILMIVGYPTETQKDIDHTFKQLEKYSYLADDGTISFLRIGGTMTMIPDTPIWNFVDELKIKQTSDIPGRVNWEAGENTLKKRVEWRVDIEDYARSLGYDCLDKEMHVEQTLIRFLEKHTV
jgi:anaerobic magnesium-protoporphyrin IX monomethyl ester cyclase